MRFVRSMAICAALAFLPAAMAQKWEFGGSIGAGFYAPHDITSSSGTASATVTSNISASAWIDNTTTRHLGGELRYDYQRGDLQLSQSSTTVNFGSQTHSIHYDLQWHFADSEAKVRPFVAVGGGVKVYQGTGTEMGYQPLSNIALLTKAQDLTAMISVGGGVKANFSPHVQLRVEIHDYLTPFPKQVITPVSGAKVGNWMMDFVPMVGLAYLF